VQIININVISFESLQTALNGLHHILAAIPAAIRVRVIWFGQRVFGGDYEVITVRFEEVA
jgi:hypothetical protein